MLLFLSFLFACYIYYLAHIVVHMCAHRSLGRNAKVNKVVGNTLSVVHLMNFEGWRAAHLMHHRFTNTARDPHLVDCSMAKYVLTHYYKISKAVWVPSRFLTTVALPFTAILLAFAWCCTQGYHMTVLKYGGLYWMGPLLVSHMLMAHFNYITHVDKPVGRGQDTRSFKRGLWKVINFMTFNFYCHGEHHLAPGYAVPPQEMKKAARIEPAAPSMDQYTTTSPESQVA